MDLEKKVDWLLDSCALRHVTRSEGVFTNLEYQKGLAYVVNNV